MQDFELALIALYWLLDSLFSCSKLRALSADILIGRSLKSFRKNFLSCWFWMTMLMTPDSCELPVFWTTPLATLYASSGLMELSSTYFETALLLDLSLSSSKGFAGLPLIFFSAGSSGFSTSESDKAMKSWQNCLFIQLELLQCSVTRNPSLHKFFLEICDLAAQLFLVVWW